MRNLKRLAALALVMIMSVAMMLPAFAKPGVDPAGDSDPFWSHTPPPDYSTEGRDDNQDRYDIYQVFTGTYAEDESGNKVLSDIRWGVNGGPDPADFDAVGVTPGDKVDSAILDRLAAANISHIMDGATFFQNFEDVVNFCDPYQSSLTKDEINALTDVEPGYYVFVNTYLPSGYEVVSNYVVTVTDGTFDFNPKKYLPTVKKTAGGGGTVGAAVGDDLSFTVTVELPENMYFYEKYNLELTDTMSAGLTYNNDVVVKWEDFDDMTASCTVSCTGGVLSIVLPEMIQYAADGPNGLHTDGCTADIVITYSAKVNQDAVLGADVNNSVVLKYSNNPNYHYDDQHTTSPMGTTVPGDGSKVRVLTTGLAVEHFNSNGKPLVGSQFELSGNNVKTVIKYTSQFTQAADGTYYKLKSGGYTAVAPADATRDQYDLDAGRFARTDTVDAVDEAGLKTSGTIDANGSLILYGLKAGDYVLKNLSAPDGHNRVENVSFTISFDAAAGTFSSGNPDVWDGGDGLFHVSLRSEKGTILPQTGGMGAGIFVLSGLGLAMAAAVVLIRRKRAG